ncbi:MAG: hypothetical protein M1824_006335 [Vezdaea acicularis]|nr:MAG: hypothetical protein M1824_006335 [Vezdaea acicularis]
MFRVARSSSSVLTRYIRQASISPLSVSTSRSYILSSHRALSSQSPPSRLLHQSRRDQQQAAAVADVDGQDDYSPSDVDRHYTDFQELADSGLVDKKLVRAITDSMGFKKMTEVQAATINPTVRGSDVAAQAKTGTGKTLGFLLPVMQNVIRSGGLTKSRTGKPTDIHAIIISPTRELAEQIAVDARRLARESRSGIIVETAVGGSRKREGLQRIQNGCHVLVGTPGRLHDILSDPSSGVSAPRLNTLVLDEADRLLDIGFAEAIMDIVDLLPPREEVDRQTLLFSATIPEEVMRMVNRFMKPNYEFIRTVKPGEQQTHEKVPQKAVELRSFENMFPALVELCKRELAKPDGPPFKAMIYFNSTRMVDLAENTLANIRDPASGTFGKNALAPAKIIAIHGKMTQGERTFAARDFKNAKSAILLSSDVTARGMDFPGVTHVIQMGSPRNRDDYIHRVGRTGRADKDGEGWLLYASSERDSTHSVLRKLPLKMDHSLETANVDMGEKAQLPVRVADILTQVGESTRQIRNHVKTDAWLSMLPQTRGREAQSRIEQLNRWSMFGFGFPEPPTIAADKARKMGIANIPGINIGEPRGRRAMDDFSEDGGFGERDGFRGRSSGFGGRDRGRGGFGDRGDRNGARGFGDRGFGDRNGGRGFGDRGRGGSSFGDRGGERGRSSGGFGGRERGRGQEHGRGQEQGGFLD